MHEYLITINTSAGASQAKGLFASTCAAIDAYMYILGGHGAISARRLS